ncbi:MAG: protein-disulfide reductase DsbD [Pseudomonadota bacterium]
MKMTTPTIGTQIAGLLALVFAAVGAHAQELVPPDQAFTYTVSDDAGELVVDWQVKPGYYLYKKKLSFALQDTTATTGGALLPRGQQHSDEFFGEQEIYERDFQVRVPYTANGASSATLVIKSQGCSSDLGICFPPQTWSRENIALNAKPISSGAAASPFGSASASNDFLPPDEAFQPIITNVAGNELEIGWQIAPGYYLYKSEFAASFDDSTITTGNLQLPTGKPKTDEYFGETEVFYDSVFATVDLARANAEPTTAVLTLTYQGCAEDGICYPVIERTFDISLPAGDTRVAIAPLASASDSASSAGSAGSGDGMISEQARLAALISNGNIFLVLSTFFGLGLLLAFTPCVLPMIPILSGIIAGDGDNVTPMRGFSLALLYVLGMALTYAIAGAAFAAAGQQAQTIFQQPWILITFAGLFVVLSLSMFGMFELQMPSSIQTKIANISGNQKSGTAVGAFVMGALSSLVVTACVAPPLIAALTVISQTGDVLRGGLVLFALSMGMGAPLLLVGASAGRLLPKAGAWMETVKQGFGFIMLGLAIWMLARLLPGEVVLLLWAVLIFVAGIYLGAMSPLPEAASGGRKLGKSFGMLATLYGAILFVGALAGGEDPLQPLKGSVLEARMVSGGGEAAHDELQFRRIKTVADLDSAIASANAQGQAVMLDFYADWCVSCKEMEKYTFTDPTVQTALANTVLLQADVTANDDDDQALLKRFELFGPPSIIFFGADGIERENYEVVGYMKAGQFAEHARAAVASGNTTAQTR